MPYFNTDGRVFKMVLNEDDPTIVDELSIVAQGLLAEQLTAPAPPPTPTSTSSIRASDSARRTISMSAANSLMLQEDASNAKIWRFDLASTWTHVGTVTHPTAPAAGESSGIIDMSAWLGPGWWALDVQSHVNKTLGPAGQTYVTPLTGAS